MTAFNQCLGKQQEKASNSSREQMIVKILLEAVVKLLGTWNNL
jgi:hypothetical protein